jgi:Flp pilus assembly pilin Flp
MLEPFLKRCDAQDLVEYALLVAVVALGAVAALKAFETVISAAWSAISANLST